MSVASAERLPSALTPQEPVGGLDRLSEVSSRICLNACRHAAALILLIALAPGAVAAQETRLASGNWTRGLAGGWGHSWTAGVVGDGTTNSGVQFVAFHPQLGRFVTDHLEFYGEGTLLVYHRPSLAVAGGLAGLGGRYHIWNDRPWTPYIVGGAGLIWTGLDVPELDRTLNFQLLYGLGLRVVPPRGPGLILELRNHHISNAGTVGENIGLNAATMIAGVQWVLR